MKNELRQVIKEDKAYYYGGGLQHLWRLLTRSPVYRIGKYVVLCRKAGYYQIHHETLISKLLLVVYAKRKNVLGEKLNIEFGPSQFGRRLRIYHRDIVVNAGAVIGDDCELYGNNCIGNRGSGFPPLDAPTIGNNVSVGVGTKIIGKITVCDNAKISSMSFVNKSLEEEFSLYGGVPARLLKTIR